MDKAEGVLVLGGNGFIGSYLVDALAVEGYRVVALDRFRSKPQFNDHPNVSVLQGDIFDADIIEQALSQIAYVVHSFSATTPYSSDINPYFDIDKNLMNTVKIFEACAKQKVKKIVYISSGGAIYGASAENGRSAKETDVALPVSPYGIVKLATERYLEYFHKKYGIQHVSYRLSNPYGSRQTTKHNQGVVPLFIKNIKAGTTLKLYGDGSSSRDYIYVEDAAKLIARSFKDGQHTVYNLGSGKQTSLTELISILESLLNSEAKTESLPEPPSSVRTTQLDVSRFAEEFSMSYELELKEGLAKTIEQLQD